MSDAVKHEETRLTASTKDPRFEDDTISKCTCGAFWRHPAVRSVDEMDAIFASHVKYFERATVVL
jgi:hypothetical protein